jgi:hypothetical protein
VSVPVVICTIAALTAEVKVAFALRTQSVCEGGGGTAVTASAFCSSKTKLIAADANTIARLNPIMEFLEIVMI